MYGIGLLAADFAKRTNLGIPNEINAVRVPRRADPGPLDSPLKGTGKSGRRAPCDCPARVPGRIRWGRLDSGPTGGVFPARLEAGVSAAPPPQTPPRGGGGPRSAPARGRG